MHVERMVRIALRLQFLDVRRQRIARLISVQEDVPALVRDDIELPHVAAFW